MSPRAACRLEGFGFTVYDYAAGKVDWIAAGWPTEGTASTAGRVLHAVDRDVPTCAPADRLDGVRARFPGAEVCVVVNDQRVVLGRLRFDRLGATGGTAEDVMQPGPATIRTHEDLDATLDRMAKRRVTGLLVTTPDGELLGLIRARPAAP